MACYLVTYDLNNETVRPDILTDIKALGGWAKLSESSYAITTSKTPLQIYEHLEEHLDDDDNLYVITLSKPYSGQGPEKVNAWLEKNLPG